jgi:hypothetical protein
MNRNIFVFTAFTHYLIPPLCLHYSMKPPPLVVVQEKVLPVQSLLLLDSSNTIECYLNRRRRTYLNSPMNVPMEDPEATTSGGGSSLD